MRTYLRFFITFLGLLELCSTAPGRKKRQITTTDCQKIFNASCDSLLGPATNLRTPPDSPTTIKPKKTVHKIIETECECVPYYRCGQNRTLNKDGIGLIDIRQVSDDECPNYLDICCLVDSIKPIFAREPKPTQTPLPMLEIPRCGYRNDDGAIEVPDAGIPNAARFGEFPWMVAILLKAVAPATRSQYTCGGSLIHPRAVLTAAHNVEKKKPEDLVVRAGEWDTQTLSEPITHAERAVEAIILHEDYNIYNLQNDFAILILKVPFDLAPHINVICLPEEWDNFDATDCTLTRWDKDEFEQVGVLKAVLKKIDVPVVSHDSCETSLRSTELEQSYNLDQSFLCAGGLSSMTACTGVGGSPLICPLANHQNRYVQAGIVSWGINCDIDQMPDIYGNVAKARWWIDNKIAEYNLDASSYIV